MKSRYWFISIIVLLLTCSYLLYYFYEAEKSRKIEEIFGHQKIHAKQAARSFYELFDKWNSILFYLARDRDVIETNEKGKYDLNLLLGVFKNEIKGITRTDKNGKIIYTVPDYSNSIGADISKQKHVAKILKNHRPVVSDVFLAVQGYRAIVIHYPVFKNGKFDGSIAFLIDFGKITKKILDDIKIGKSGYAIMISQGGIELYCPIRDHIGKSIFETAKDFPDQLMMAKRMVAGEEGTARYTYDRTLDKIKLVKKIAYFLPITIGDSFWSVAVVYSEDEITSSLVDFRSKLILIFALIFLGGVSISYFGFKAWGIVKETEARKSIEKNLLESEERYRSISTVASDYMFSSRLQPDGSLKHNWVAGAFETITGYTYNEYVARGGWLAALHPDDLKQDEEDMKKLLNNEKVISEIRTIAKNGNIVWVRVYAHPVWDEKNNRLLAITGAVQDITSRKKAEEELKKLYKATEQSPASIIITNIKGEIEYVNETFKKVSGYALDEVIGKYLRILNPERNKDSKQIWDTIFSGSEWRGEYLNKKKDGSTYWESTLISPIKSDDGKITNIIAIQEDISEKKKNYEELILAKEKAENANRVKNIFLANMSHELRTPLIGILGYSEMLKNDLQQEDKKEMAMGILRSGNRLLNTLNLILDLTKFESDRFELNLKKINLVDEIKIAYETFKGAAMDKKLDFLLRLENETLLAKMDERMFKIILENLINNAIKFTSKGSITIIAGIENNKIIFIRIEDTGIGIAKEHHDVIFEEFRQVSEGINRDYQGTGLGLSITKKYVEILNGNISVESMLGEGSVFTIRFPVYDDISNA
jgi:PAS domain S-box-containing protein